MPQQSAFFTAPDDVVRLVFERGLELFHTRPLASRPLRFPCYPADQNLYYEKERQGVLNAHSFCTNVSSVNKHWFGISADLRFQTLFLSGKDLNYNEALKVLQKRIGPQDWFSNSKSAGQFVEHLDISIVYVTDALMRSIPQILTACNNVGFLTVRIERSTSLHCSQVLLDAIKTSVGPRLKHFEWYVPIMVGSVPLCIGEYFSIMDNLCHLDLHDANWNTPDHVRHIILPNLHTLRLRLSHCSLMRYVNTWGLPLIKIFIFACSIFSQSLGPLLDFFRINGRKLNYLELEGIPEDSSQMEAILEKCPNVHDLVVDMSLSTETLEPHHFPSIHRLGIRGSSVYDVPIYIANLVTLVYEEHLFQNCIEIRLLDYNRVNLKTCYSVDSAHVIIRAIDRAERLRCERPFALLDDDGEQLQKKDVYVQIGVAGNFVPYTTGVIRVPTVEESNVNSRY